MKKAKSIILLLSFLLLCICVIFFAVYLIDDMQDRKDKEELIRMKAVTEAAITDISQPDQKEILSQYKILKEENSDLIGWIKIDDTPLDYPVMQNPKEKEYYLHRNFYGEYEYSGLPFLDLKCSLDPPSTNLIIYGHNMKSESMFSCLTDYINQDFYLKHPIIRFDTLYEEGEYEIVAVILSQVYKKTDNVFKFYQFIQADNEIKFNEYIQNMKKLSLYDTGVDASYGDQLLTLVTCYYHTENGRLAILARKVNH